MDLKQFPFTGLLKTIFEKKQTLARKLTISVKQNKATTGEGKVGWSDFGTQKVGEDTKEVVVVDLEKSAPETVDTETPTTTKTGTWKLILLSAGLAVVAGACFLHFRGRK